MGIKKFVGCTYFNDEKLNSFFARYFTDAGFEVLGMEGMDTTPYEADKISTDTIYQHLKILIQQTPNGTRNFLLGSRRMAGERHR